MSGSSVTKYYYFGGQRVAQRNSGTLYYLHADHLGSTVLTTSGANATEQFRAYGAVRGYSGSNPSRYSVPFSNVEAAFSYAAGCIRECNLRNPHLI